MQFDARDKEHGDDEERDTNGSDQQPLKVRMEEANLVQLGSESHGFLVLRKDTPAAKVDHFAISIDGMTNELVTQAQTAQGRAPQDEKNALGFYATDPDGYSIQYAR